MAAEFRSLIRKDLDDEILWLTRARQGNPNVKASLAMARGHKAMLEDNDETAERDCGKRPSCSRRSPKCWRTERCLALL